MKKSDGVKALSLRGRAKGGVLANGAALHLLRNNGQRHPSWDGRELVVVITEGEIDYLVASCEPDEAVRAVFGITMQGAWSIDFAARIPFDARVEVATDSDPAGNKYARDIGQTLAWHPHLWRWRPWDARKGRSRFDLSEVFGLRGGTSHVFS